MENLSIILQSKKANVGYAKEVVTESANWLKKQFQEAQVPFNYADCDRDYCGFATFQIYSIFHGIPVNLFLKIAEIKSQPYVFADIRVRDGNEAVLFPFFGEIGSEDGRELVLNYIADYILSVELN